MTTKIVPKIWGLEQWIVNNAQYCCKMLVLNQGHQCSLHYHVVKKETFYLMRGFIHLTVGSETWIFRPGDSVTIEPGTVHRFYGQTDATILEVSTHHDDSDVVRLEESV